MHIPIKPTIITPLSLNWGLYCPVHSLNQCFCFSKTIKVTIVCGHNLTKLGVHPRNMNFIPSCLRASLRMAMDPVDLSLEFMILVLHTSMGEHLQLVQRP